MSTRAEIEPGSVSVIVAVKNGERFLDQALESIFAQTRKPTEILLVDGASTDSTCEIARSFPGVRLVMQTGRGIGDAYNSGVAASSSEFVAFLSHDDRWGPDKLQRQLDFMLEHSDVMFTLTHIQIFLEQGSRPPPGFRAEWLAGSKVGQVMETLVARRALFDQVGLFDPTLSTGEDADWFARANDLGVRQAVIPEVLLYKRMHSTNLSLTTRENNRNLLEVLRRSVARKNLGKR